MDVVDISRWQFGITTVYHFVLVPLTIGLAPMIAVMQTVWYVTGNEAWLRATKFFGKLFTINFILGLATGIVQEFQFGMNWSDYSRFVGDIFGAPLAIEALLAFFEGRVAKWWIPDDVVFVDALPMTATGKISKKDLRSKFADFQLPDLAAG